MTFYCHFYHLYIKTNFMKNYLNFEQEIKNIDLHLESNTVRCESIEKDRERIVLDKKKLSERREELLTKLSDANKSVEEYQLVLDEKQDGLDDHVQKKLDLEEKILEKIHQKHHQSHLIIIY